MTVLPLTEWRTLRTASGKADAIPDAVQELSSNSEETRKAAYWKIDNHAVCQGDLYEAAPFVVAELLNALRCDPPYKEEIYNLLVEFANGTAPESSTVSIEGGLLPLRDATRLQIARGLELYWRDFGSPATTTRRHVADLLLRLSEYVNLERGKIVQVLNREVDERVRSILGELLKELEGDPNESAHSSGPSES